MPTWLVILLWNIRNVAARTMSDMNPAGYDMSHEDGDGMVPTAPDAYSAIGADGFRLFGAFGTVAPMSVDPLTGATGFDVYGEASGLSECGSDTAFDAEQELHDARVRLEWLDNASEVVRLTSEEREEQDELTERAESLMYADGGPSEGMVSTEDMNVPYWTECADSHIADMEKAERLSDSGYTFPTARDISARANIDAAEGRVKRLEVLRKRLQKAVCAYRAAHRSGVQGAGQKVLNHIATFVGQVKTDAAASYTDCKRSGNWVGLYLTSAQVEEFGLYVRRTRRACEVVRAQPVVTHTERLADLAGRIERTSSDLRAALATVKHNRPQL